MYFRQICHSAGTRFRTTKIAESHQGVAAFALTALCESIAAEPQHLQLRSNVQSMWEAISVTANSHEKNTCPRTPLPNPDPCVLPGLLLLEFLQLILHVP